MKTRHGAAGAAPVPFVGRAIAALLRSYRLVPLPGLGVLGLCVPEVSPGRSRWSVPVVEPAPVAEPLVPAPPASLLLPDFVAEPVAPEPPGFPWSMWPFSPCSFVWPGFSMPGFAACFFAADFFFAARFFFFFAASSSVEVVVAPLVVAPPVPPAADPPAVPPEAEPPAVPLLPAAPLPAAEPVVPPVEPVVPPVVADPLAPAPVSLAPALPLPVGPCDVLGPPLSAGDVLPAVLPLWAEAAPDSARLAAASIPMKRFIPVVLPRIAPTVRRAQIYAAGVDAFPR